MINIEQAVTNKYPSFANKSPLFRKPTISLLKRLVYEDRINEFLTKNSDAKGFEFIDRVFEYFDYGYSIKSSEKANIPATGRVVIIANHPIGSLDGLAILRLISEVRSDVKIVANDMLSHFSALDDLIIPLDNMTGGSARRSYKKVLEALEKEQAIIVFPAGEVSRAHPTGIKDCQWRPGFLNFARRSKSPILPVFIGAKNSFLFYSASMIFKPLGTALLAHEMFNKQSRTIKFRVGKLIRHQSLSSESLQDRTLVKRLKRHVYKLGKDGSKFFETETTIAHPEDRQQIQEEFKSATIIGDTRDGNRIYLVDYKDDSAIIREIGRLRELAFRKVGEGTGRKRDLDDYDKSYRHLVLWNCENLEIAGAYRVGEGKALLDKYGEEGFYTRSLYRFNPNFHAYLEQGVELGRSFVNPDYWGKASLDYLWQGLGAYLATQPQIRYLIGPVSMSADYPRELMNMLAYFYKRYYPSQEQLAIANNPYLLTVDTITELDRLFAEQDLTSAFDFMQKQFISAGYRLPVLFKQYASLFDEGGFQAIVFSVDPDFGDCLDGLCMADLHKLKAAKRKRYVRER